MKSQATLNISTYAKKESKPANSQKDGLSQEHRSIKEKLF